ncbi:MAG: hypothetical protein AB7P34_01555 [Vicinamibacterales bacterium]
MAVVSAIGLVVTSAQVIANRALFGPGALLDWGAIRHWHGTGLAARVVAAVVPADPFSVVAVAALRCTAAVALIAAVVVGVSPAVPLAGIVAANALLTLRIPAGLTGADQMANVVALALLVGEFAGTPGARAMTVVFIGLQSCLAYTTAGFVKYGQVGWHDGSFIREIFSTRSLGLPVVARWMQRSGWLPALIGKAVVIGECAFPLILILPPDAMVVALGLGVVFHLVAAVIMGLNTFLWVFPATYPALLYLGGWVRSVVT